MFKTQTKKLQKLLTFAAAIFAVIFVLCGSNVFAVTNTLNGITVSSNGWRNISSGGLGENKIHIDTSKFSLDTAIVDHMDEDFFAIVNETHYDSSNISSFNSQRSSAYTFGSTAEDDHKSLIIKREVAGRGPSTITETNKYVLLRWVAIAEDQSGQKYDVTMKIDNIYAVISDNNAYESDPDHPVLHKVNTGIQLFRHKSHISYNQLQAYPQNLLKQNGSGSNAYWSVNTGKYWSNGASYDVEIKLYETGTNNLISADNSAMAMSFRDIDVPDKTKNPTNHNRYWSSFPLETNTVSLTRNPDYGPGGSSYKYLKNDDGIVQPAASDFTEAIEIKSGLKDNKVFTWNNGDAGWGNYAYYSSNSSSPTGLKVSGTTLTGAEGQPDDNSSRFVTLVDARGFKYRWSGSDCGTVVGFIGPAKVETEVTGDYSGYAKITPTDNKVLWRENKEIVIEVNDGYALDTIMIDGVATPISDLTFDSRTDGVRKYKYVFNDVIEDHEIIVSVKPLEFEIDKYNGASTPAFVSGAKLQLTGTKSGTAIDFSADPTIYSQISNISTDNTKLIWVTTGAADILYSLPTGDYTLTELDPPAGYIPSADITFTVGGSNDADNAILSSNPSGAQTAIRTIKMVDTEDTPSSFGDVLIGKNVAGDGGDTEKEFTINLAITTCSNSTPSYIPYELDIDTQEASVGSVTLTNDPTLPRSTGTFVLVHNWGIALKIPVGCSYEIWEDNYSSDSYSTSYNIKNIHGNASLVNGKVVGDILGTGKSDDITITNAKTIPTVTGVETDVGMIPFILSGAMIAGAGVFIVRRAQRLKT